MTSSFARVAKTIAFDENTAATHTVFTPDADKRFVVTKWYLQSNGAANTFQFVSNATGISGVITTAGGGEVWTDGSGDEPVLVGLVNGDALKVVLGAAQQVTGYFVYALLQE